MCVEKVKYLRFLIAGVFILSGIGKLCDVVGFQDLIATYGFPILQISAPFIVIGEVAMGVVLLLGIQLKKATTLMVVLVLLFTMIYTYGYLKHGIRECGCFGALDLRLHPMVVYARNLILVAFGIYVHVAGGEGYSWKEIPLFRRIIAWTIILPTVFVAGMNSRLFIAKPYLHPFENNVVEDTDLKEFVDVNAGRVLVSFMNYSCRHCLNSVENYASYYRKGWVDTSFCYMMTKQIAVPDTSVSSWHEAFAEIGCLEIDGDSIGFVEAFPTTFIIENDTVKNVIIGELPSAFTLFNDKIKR